MATAPSAGNPSLRFGVFEVDTQTGELRKSGRTIRLRPQAAKVLIALATRPDQLVTREELKDQIWGQETFVDFEHGLNLCIQQIRASLDDDADIPRYIETLPRRGYRFIAPVQDAKQEKELGRYRITAKIGAGGMGEVYLAQDARLGREVAIKVLPPGALQDESARSRFRREAEILSKLSHPNIATVYDFEKQEGKDLLVMEYVRGVTLSDKLAAGPLPEKDVLRLGLQLAEGIEAAHDHGVIHRDLKPGNLRVTPEGWLKILDFGLAKSALSTGADVSTQTIAETGAVRGTLRYMAPEQLLAQNIDARTDIYAIGSILYEMATGQAPFYNQVPTALVDAILHQSARPPRQLNSAVSVKLEDIILKCLEKEPASRYQSAKELAVDLRRVAPASITAPVPVTARRFTRRQMTVAAAVLLMIAGIALAWANPGDWRSRLFAGSPRPVRSIAVLPLLNLTGDASQEYFADGMTEALTTDLARMESLQVISRSSTMGYKGSKKALPEMAKELHADAVIEGSVQRSGDRVRITAQLVRADTDKHLWADTYERDFHDILALQDDVASAIAKQVQFKLGGPEPLPIAKSTPISPEAYETYLKANSYQDQFALRKSIDYYNQVIKLAPDYAPAYAHMASSYFFLGFFGAMPPQQAFGKMKELGLLATAKDNQLPDGHSALATAKLHYDWDFAGAEQEFKRAIELNPNDADTLHGFAHYLMAMGRMDESAAQSRRAVELDPVDDGLTDCLCWHSYAARQYDSSIQLALEVLKRQPDDTWEMVILGWDYEQQHRNADAVAQFKKAVDATPKQSLMYPFLLGVLGHAYASAGNKSDAQAVLQTLLARAKESYASPFDIALIYTALGDKDAAFAWLDKAVAERSTWLVYSKWEPRLDPLRYDPRFPKLLQRIGLAS
ncbi:MAG TPA: protein kinase [Candidatus Acidoferrum sp.]|nr:protein kinase [Candidatus Acidoferrum sp.]